eukprot:scaffold4484_cov98-Isochrysis_galbana.AAC.2
MPASERGALAMATVSDVRLPRQYMHGNPVAQAPARLIRLVRPPAVAAGVIGVSVPSKATTPRRQCHGHGAESSRGRDPSAAPANRLSCRE